MRDIEQFVDFVDLPLSEVKLQHFWDWVDHLKEKGALPATQARKLAAVKSLFSFAHRIGYLPFNVGAAVTLPKIPEKLSERILTESDIHQILAQASTLVIPASVWKELMELKSETESTESNQPVFRSRKGGSLSRQQIWRIVRNAAKSAGFDQNISPHRLRHAHASHALDHGAPVHLVKESLGHQSLTTTSKYAHARPDESSSKYIDI